MPLSGPRGALRALRAAATMCVPSREQLQHLARKPQEEDAVEPEPVCRGDTVEASSKVGRPPLAPWERQRGEQV